MRCSIAEATATILAGPKPVILLDTCALLDIVRSAYRSNVHLSHLAGSRELLTKAARNEVHVVATTTIENEFQEHLRPTTLELERSLADLAAKNAAVINAIECVGLSYRFTVDGFAGIKLTDALQKIAQDVFAAGMVLDRDPDCATRAFTRVERYHAPAARGKSESKDCLIIEHYLKLVGDLRAAGFTEKALFVSSNSADYGKAPTLRAPLDTEFRACSIEYVNNFQWALAAGFS
jgi:hypothetical protein